MPEALSPQSRPIRRRRPIDNGLARPWGPLAVLVACAGLVWSPQALAQAEPAPGNAAAGAASDEDFLQIDAFAEAVQLRTLVDLFSAYLGIEVILRGELEGEVSFANPRRVPRAGVLPLMESLLDLNDYALTFDRATGFYVIQRAGDVRLSFEGDFATTRVIPTPNIRPSSLQSAVQTLLTQRPATGQPQGAPVGEGIAYIDELGVIVVSGAPRRVHIIEQVVNQLVSERREMRYIQIPLRYISAPTARDRAIEMVGGRTQPRTQAQAAQPRGVAAQDAARQQTGGGDTLDNLADRLRVSPQGNELIFRGRPDEIAEFQRVLEIIDQPSRLENKRYNVGRAAQQVADIARQRGLGAVQVLSSADQQRVGAFNPFDPRGQNPFQQQEPVEAGGSSMVVDVETGTVIYTATPEQHEQLSQLIKELDIDRDAVVTRTYKLAHANAEEVTEIILAIIEDTTRTGNQGVLPGFGGFGAAGQQVFFDPSFEDVGTEGELGGLRAGRDTRVVADPANNQLIVRARLRQQDEFAKLIERLDLRRPQVYIEATIVSVTNNVDFRLAIETQLINAGGSGGAVQTNFGLTSPGDGFTGPRSPLTGLPGLTTALIQSQYLPFVLNAIQTDTDARIISSPSLLVDDNSEAEIVSLDQQPTTSTSQDGTSTQTSFGGFEDAGTRLTVTPRISEGGYLQLTYGIELSNFIGQGSNGIPAPRQERNIRSDSVTIPGDTTIVVGGIRINDVRDTVIKVPLLGDIPILGHLFRDTNQVTNDAMLYVFIRPRIMRDDTFRDLRLMTEGPQAAVGLYPDLPLIQPVSIDIISARPHQPYRHHPAIEGQADEPASRSPTPPPAPTQAPTPATRQNEPEAATPPAPGAPGTVRRLPEPEPTPEPD